MFIDYYESPFGLLVIMADDRSLLCVERLTNPNLKQNPNIITENTKIQLELYFMRKIQTFDLPLNPLNPNKNTFYSNVWNALLQIPYGETRSYKQIADMIGNPNAFRAVGNANNKNPILIIIPCHRVIKSDGNTGGYALGSDVKQQLLYLERF